MSNNIDKFIDTLFLEASLYPKTTADKVKEYPGQLLEAVKNADTRETNKFLEKLGNDRNQSGELIKNLVIDSQRSSRDFNDRMFEVSDNIRDMSDDINYGLDRVSDGLEIVSQSIESAYGSKLPKGISTLELGKQLSFNGKRTVVALAIHGGIEESDMRKMFSNNFVNYLKNGSSGSKIKSIQYKIQEQIYQLRNINSNLKYQIENVLIGENYQMGTIDTHRKTINKNIDEVNKLKKELISEDEIKLLDLGLFCRGKNISELMYLDIIDKQVLQGLANNHKLNGNFTRELSKIFVNNSDGSVEPLINFSGDIGRRQAQMLTGYKVERGFNKTNENLEIIDNTLQDGFERTVEGLDNIAEVNREGFERTVEGLDNIAEVNRKGFNETNENLEIIDNTLQRGFTETKEGLIIINETNKQGFKQTNHNLFRIDNTLQRGFTETNDNLVDINNSIVGGLGEVNQNLETISIYTDQMNKKLGISNQELGHINMQLGIANKYLYDILDTNIETNDLLEQSNSLSQEGNQLTRVSNQILTNISREIINTKEQLVYALDMIGNTIILGFNKANDELRTIQKIGIQNLEINKEMLEELKKQSAELEKINEKLLIPGEIRSNEHFKVGLHWVEIKNWKRAIEEFEKGIKEKNDHLFNLYGAGLSNNLLGKEKKAITYFTDAYDIAIDQGNYKLAGEIAFDISKLYIKNLQLIKGKERLDQAMENNINLIEVYFLKARVCKLLEQNGEFELLINIIFNKIIEDGGNFNLKANYQDVLDYLYQPTNDIINEEIKDGLKQKLFKVLPRLEAIGHQDAVKNIVSYVIFTDPVGLNKVGVNIPVILKNNKEIFQQKYSEFAEKTFYGGQSEKFFMVAYLGYKTIDFTTIKKIIDIGFSFDIDHIDLKDTDDRQQKEIYKKKLTDKIYSLGLNAKYMLRDYLKETPDSLFYK